MDIRRVFGILPVERIRCSKDRGLYYLAEFDPWREIKRCIEFLEFLTFLDETKRVPGLGKFIANERAIDARYVIAKLVEFTLQVFQHFSSSNFKKLSCF